MSGHGARESYWPGFVDALTNVVIALIFVVLILALSLSFSAQIMAKRMAQRLFQESQQKAISQAVPADPPAASIESAAQPVLNLTVRSPREATRDTGERTQSNVHVSGLRVNIQFETGALELDRRSIRTLHAFLLDATLHRTHSLPNDATAAPVQPGGRPSSRQSRLSFAQVHVSGNLDESAPEDVQRMTYLRLMSVRNALIQAGIAPGQIRISSVSKSGGQADHIAVDLLP